MQNLRSKAASSICIALFFCSIIGIIGCATIVKGPTQEVSFDSDPTGADVILNGRVLGQTPFTLLLKKKSGQSITVEKKGYKSKTFELTTQIEGWFLGNILVGGLIGSTTDGLSGSVTQYSPSQYFITLPPVKSGVEQPLSDKAKAKTFIITAYSNILTELNSQPGEYVNSMLSLLKVTEDNKEKSISIIHGISSQNLTIPEFAEKVTNLFL